jgi:hypothetical protein
MRQVSGTNLPYSSVAGWLDLVYRVGSQPRASTPFYQRCRLLYRSLRLDDIRACRDLAALAGLEQLFDRARHWQDLPAGYGLQRVMARSEIGALLVETRNRLEAVRSGRADRQRRPGPRFDAQRLPDAALERLIQHHPDLGVVEQLRAERRRRSKQGH